MSKQVEFRVDYPGIGRMLKGMELRNACSSAVSQLGRSTGIPGRVDVRSGQRRAIARYTTAELSYKEKQQFFSATKGIAKRRAF